MSHDPPHGRPPQGSIVRRTLLYGAAFGLLVGLGVVAVSGTEGREAIALWRNIILAGAALGLIAGLIRRARTRDTPHSPQDQQMP